MNQLLAHLPSGRPYLLVTGVTGLLGQYLMRDLLLHGRSLAVLVRSTSRATGVQRVNAILQRCEAELNQPLPRPIVIEGDVCQSNLGLSRRQLRWIAENCDSVLHNAASLQFQGEDRSADPWRTNLNGTQHVVELARRTDIRKLHYVSTAYVCGKRSTPVLESDLDCGQQFRNDYEHSKFLAEHVVRSAHHLDSATVYRPVVITGDSETGFTSTYHGIFLYLRLIATIVPMLRQNSEGWVETPIQLPLNGNEPRNLVSVDWVSKVITQLMGRPEAEGLTYHLSPDHCLTTKEFLDYCCEYFHTYGVEYVGREGNRATESEFLTRIFENVKVYEDYEASDPHFDKTNLLKFAGHIACPRMDRETIFRFIEFGQANRWGKLRPVAIGESLSNLELSAASVPNS